MSHIFPDDFHSYIIFFGSLPHFHRMICHCLQNTMNRTRIYVFLGPVYALVNMMEAMDAVQLFSKGEYMVIFVDMMTYSTREAQKYIWKPDHLNKHSSCNELDNFKQRAKSLLVIVSSPPAENYQNFTEQVREFNKKEPFHFSTPVFFKNYQKVFAFFSYSSSKGCI